MVRANRREFLAALAGTQAGLSEPAAIEANGCRLLVDTSGDIISLKHGHTELVDRRLGSSRPEVVVIGKRLLACERPATVRRDGPALAFEFRLGGVEELRVDYEISLRPLGASGAVCAQKIALSAGRPPRESLMVRMPRTIRLPSERRQVFLPLKNGIGRRQEMRGLDNDDEYLFAFAGSFAGGRPQSLAVPLVDEFADTASLRLAHCADPFFTTYLRLPWRGRPGQLHWIYPERPGLEGREERTVYTVLHEGGPDAALRLFGDTALSAVRPGPAWLGEVAMVGFDYLAKNGAGWFADVNRLAEVIAPVDRPKVLLALHGWYDCVGRYCYNQRTHSLDKTWTAFPSARDPDVQAFAHVPALGDSIPWNPRSVPSMRPVEMSLAEVRRRLRYARQKGFRVMLYFADGLNASEGDADTWDPARMLRWGGWKGPDTKGRSYLLNPLHPAVRDFFKDYLEALIAEFGQEMDGLVWDETYYVSPGETGPEGCPGYADRAMMTLVRELAGIAERRGQVFMASDNIGLKSRTQRAPYGLMAHGTYQDSSCRPEVWPYGLLPNCRNVLWSCNWAPVSHFDFTAYGTEMFETPVAIANGPYGDDIGIADMSPRQLKATLELFNRRKRVRMQPGWIEERAGLLTYKGRELKYRYSL